MKKTITICDICQDEIQDKIYICEICKREICESCFSYLELNTQDENFSYSIEILKPILICEKCNEKVESWCKGFFKDEDAKLQLNAVRDKLKTFLTKSIMLNKL